MKMWNKIKVKSCLRHWLSSFGNHGYWRKTRVITQWHHTCIWVGGSSGIVEGTRTVGGFFFNGLGTMTVKVSFITQQFSTYLKHDANSATTSKETSTTRQNEAFGGRSVTGERAETFFSFQGPTPFRVLRNSWAFTSLSRQKVPRFSLLWR